MNKLELIQALKEATDLPKSKAATVVDRELSYACLANRSYSLNADFTASSDSSD